MTPLFVNVWPVSGQWVDGCFAHYAAPDEPGDLKPCKHSVLPGQHKDAPAVQVPTPITGVVKSFNGRMFCQNKPLLVVDVPGSIAKQENKSPSLVNQQHVTVIAALVKELVAGEIVQGEDIVVLSGYDAQYCCVLAAVGGLKMVFPDSSMRNVLVKKIDRFQEGEREVVIFDITGTKTAGFLQQGNRLNVALYRIRETSPWTVRGHHIVQTTFSSQETLFLCTQELTPTLSSRPTSQIPDMLPMHVVYNSLQAKLVRIASMDIRAT